MTIYLATIEARARNIRSTLSMMTSEEVEAVGADCLALIARLRLADELVAALSSVATEGLIKEELCCYTQGIKLMECLRRWHEGEKCTPG